MGTVAQLNPDTFPDSPYAIELQRGAASRRFCPRLEAEYGRARLMEGRALVRVTRDADGALFLLWTAVPDGAGFGGTDRRILSRRRSLFELTLPVAIHAGAFLVMAVIACAMAARHFEKCSRTGFLEDRLIADLAQHDALTGTKNRRVFDEHLTRLWQQAIEDGRAVAVW